MRRACASRAAGFVRRDGGNRRGRPQAGARGPRGSRRHRRRRPPRRGRLDASRRQSPTSRRKSPTKARALRLDAGDVSRMTTRRCMSARACRPSTRPSRRRSGGATTSARPSTSSSRSTPTSITAPPTDSASPRRASGSIAFIAADAEDFDATVDPVWEARTRIEASAGPPKCGFRCRSCASTRGDEQVWGLNVQRFVPSNNEADYWIAVPRTEKAWASHFGELRGIDGVKPAASLELLPYVAGSSTLTGNRDRRNPFDDGKNLAGRAGADVKIGFGPNLTLDATVNPDFGQVEADPGGSESVGVRDLLQRKAAVFHRRQRLLNSPFESSFIRGASAPAPIGPAPGDFRGLSARRAPFSVPRN